MSVLSIGFLVFLLFFAFLYYLCPGRMKPYVLLAASIAFYLTFDWRYFLFLLFSVTTVWLGAILLEKYQEKYKKIVAVAVLIANIGLLAIVKYLPYTVNQIFTLIASKSVGVSFLVPIGISFYTLQVCGYFIDVYRGQYMAEKNFFKFMLFASFFPLILQGPISRYSQIAPQLYRTEKCEAVYDNLTTGAQLMLWGFFKKLVIADRAAIFVAEVFTDYQQFDSLTLLFAVVCYTLQIYTDFSGCVDICRGAGRLFGIDIIDNFNHPYFALSIQDFWRRWHISLSSWFRDYIYISLGGNRKGTIRKYINVLIVFFTSGLWHGVGIHFIVWGVLHGVYQIIGAVTLPAKKWVCDRLRIDRQSVLFRNLQRVITFILINISWVFFRAENTRIACGILYDLLRKWNSVNVTALTSAGLDLPDLIVLAVATAFLFMVSLVQYKGVIIQKSLAASPIPIRWSVYLLGFLVVLIFGVYGPGYSSASFIYMNF